MMVDHIGLNNIDFITIATLGNAKDFGDLQQQIVLTLLL